jgi:hypothetical protein
MQEKKVDGKRDIQQSDSNNQDDKIMKMKEGRPQEIF